MTSGYSMSIDRLMAQITASHYNPGVSGDSECTGLTEDSRKVAPGYLFIARPGLESDGRRYIHQAVASGAIAVLAEGFEIEHFAQVNNCKVPVYTLDNLLSYLGELADTFYNKPSASMTVIGITGTNGKTSCSLLIARLLAEAGEQVAVMGTLGNGNINDLDDSANTTVDALSMHQTLAVYRDQGIKFVVMEVSSHALVQGRVKKVRFNCAVFTNLSRDHLDYHGDMASYGDAKRQLFVYPELQTVIINADDTLGNKILSDSSVTANKISYSITPINARQADNSIYTETVRFEDTGITADLVTPWASLAMSTQLIGQFNLSNCLAAIATLGSLGFDLESMISSLAKLPAIEGRMECFGGNDKPLVVVDYAHTPEALMHALRALRPHTQHRLWCVFGCGGDRDRGKRPEMSSVAEEYADHLMITSDNPRSESMQDIVDEMLLGLNNPESAQVELDRKNAIQITINKAVTGDVVLVAGKGHEQYQEIGKERKPHSDIYWVQQVLEMGNWS